MRTGLAPLVRRYRLAELDANLALRGWLGTAISHALVDEADLAVRSGLEVLGIDAFDMRCEVWDEIRQVHQTYFLRASLAQAEAADRVVVDKQVLAQVEAHLPIKERLVERKDRLATLEERERLLTAGCTPRAPARMRCAPGSTRAAQSTLPTAAGAVASYPGRIVATAPLVRTPSRLRGHQNGNRSCPVTGDGRAGLATAGSPGHDTWRWPGPCCGPALGPRP